ncbi:MAG: toxin [Alphaproteobacteria bacterium]|nr:toxin [Alphaproteobacteria bacterium]
MMKFEYDPEKSAANLAKHGIDFETAQSLWLDPDLLEIKAKTLDEPRSMIIGRIEDKHWSAIVTYRDASIRLISVRRSRDKEIDIYEST